VGPVTAKRLRAHGIDRLVDVRTIATDELRTIVGSLAPWLQQLAEGMDDRPVEPNRDAKSASSENTFDQDLIDAVKIRDAVDDMARGVVKWLVKKDRVARTVTLKVRYSREARPLRRPRLTRTPLPRRPSPSSSAPTRAGVPYACSASACITCRISARS
jgi:nucleotidyltransferase/DNA polymerase involved in DNA repair